MGTKYRIIEDIKKDIEWELKCLRHVHHLVTIWQQFGKYFKSSIEF